MPTRILIGFAVCLLFSFARANAQTCPLGGTSSGKLVCVIPQTFGSFGLGSGPGAPLSFNNHQGHFESDFLSSFEPINEAVAIQVSQLPIASPSSGITFAYDPTLKTFAPSTEETLGPILGERAGSIGSHRLYVAFSFQYFNFDTIDGKDLGNLPAVFQHQPVPVTLGGANTPNTPCQNQTGLTGAFANQPCFVRDFIQTFNKVDLRVHQYTIYATYGLTRRLDFSVAVPLLDVSIKNTATAAIHSNSVAPKLAGFPNGVFHEFSNSTVPSCGSA